MSPRGCTSDLAVRARRGDLNGAERAALDAHVSACAACRLVLDLGRAFDAPDVCALDDEARIQRLARAAEAWTRHGRSPRRSGHTRALRRNAFVLLAACLVLCGGLAAAALGTRAWAPFARVLPSPRPTPEQAPGSRGGAKPSSAGAEHDGQEPAPVAALPAGVPAAAVDLAHAASSPRVAGPRPRAHLAAASPSGEEAAAMFRAASDARRSGDDGAAMALYQKLERRFPRSPEAELSAVPLGEMLLAADRPGAALAQFDRPSGVLGGTFRPEALYGRARALAALGDEAGETRAWRQLLEEFPKCPYAEAARRRLEARSSREAPASP